MNTTRERYKTAEQGIQEEKALRKWDLLESGRGIPAASFDIVGQHERIQRKKDYKKQKQAQIDKYGMVLPNPSQLKSVRAAENIRNKIIENIAERVHLIQNAAHGETRLRDLNDTINELLKEKERVEDRIRTLNGPDYRKSNFKLSEDEKDIITVDGYHYFGAAKLLPGVKELFEKQNFVFQSKSSIEDYTGINGEYFGLTYDLQLEREEKLHEKEWQDEIKTSLKETFERDQLSGQTLNLSFPEYPTPPNFPNPNPMDPLAILDVDYNVLPTPNEMTKAILEARKQEIIDQYGKMEP